MNEEVVLGYVTITVMAVSFNGYFVAWLRSYRIDPSQLTRIILWSQAIGLLMGIAVSLFVYSRKTPPPSTNPHFQGVHAVIFPGLVAWISFSSSVLKFFCSREAKKDRIKENQPLDKWREPEAMIEPPAF